MSNINLKIQSFWPWQFIGENKKNSNFETETLNLHLALYLIFITMSKTKHPENMVLLTESEHFVHISALL